MVNTLKDRWPKFVRYHLKTNSRDCYHYTDLKGLKGIAGSKREFWFSHFSTLNDTSEVNHGLSFIDSAISNYLDRTRNYRCRELLQAAQNELRIRGTKEGCGADNFYFASLTMNGEEKEDVTHWREYANHGTGYALKFTLNESPHVLKVFYLEEDKMKILENFFGVLDPEDEVLDIVFYLIKLAVLFKHPVFRSESELRIVASLGKGERLNESYRLPYKLTQIENLDLVKIICGPNSHPDEGIGEIKIFLEGELNLDIEISKSTAPIKMKRVSKVKDATGN